MNTCSHYFSIAYF